MTTRRKHVDIGAEQAQATALLMATVVVCALAEDPRELIHKVDQLVRLDTELSDADFVEIGEQLRSIAAELELRANEMLAAHEREMQRTERAN